MPSVYLDIETLPTARTDVRDYIEESMRDELQQALDAVCAPANYKDADKITEYCTTKRAQLKAEFTSKVADKIKATGLDGTFGRVCVIGWIADDMECVHYSADDERQVLKDFAKAIHGVIPANDAFTTAVIGHNVQWDVRFLMQRYIVNGIRPPMVITRAAQAKPWEGEKLWDSMVQWAGVGGKISLDRLCMALSIPSPKGECDGSKVADFVAAGRIADVSAYCMGDVRAVREVHRRMTFAPEREAPAVHAPMGLSPAGL